MKREHKTQPRAYAGADDLKAMIELVRRRPLDRLGDFPAIADLREMMTVAEAQKATTLWLDSADKLAAFCILSQARNHASMILEVAENTEEADLGERIIGWVEDRLKAGIPDLPWDFSLVTSSRLDSTSRIALIKRLGFARQEGGTLHMERPLADRICAPQLPSGFSIRALAGEAEIDAWVRLHRAAFGTEVMTSEYRLAMMRVPDYDPALDLVATAPGGELAAYCFCFFNKEENSLCGTKKGCADPIATHPDFQRRGLAKALILAGLKLLKDRGMDHVCLGTSMDNIAMVHTAESAGFRVVATTAHWSKRIRS